MLGAFSAHGARTGDENLRCRSGKLLMHPDDTHPHYTEVPAPSGVRAGPFQDHTTALHCFVCPDLVSTIPPGAAVPAESCWLQWRWPLH